MTESSPTFFQFEGYQMSVSRTKVNVVGAITRMDEFRVDRGEETFDDILLKYKMQAEIKKGRNADSVIPLQHAPFLPRRANPNAYGDRGVAFVDLTGTNSTPPLPNKWQPEPVNKNLRNTEQEMKLQKMRFSGIEGSKTGSGNDQNVVDVSIDDEISRKCCLIVDSSMSYYDSDLVGMCRYPVLSESDLCVSACTKLIETHWENTGHPLVYNKKDGSFMNHMLYVVMPSARFLFENIVGDNLQNNPLAKRISKLYETDANVMEEKLLAFVKSLLQGLKSIKKQDSNFNPVEMRSLLRILSNAETDIHTFSMEMMEDLSSLRCFLTLRNKRIEAFKADENIAIKEEKDVDFDLNIIEENVSVVFDTSNVSSVDNATSQPDHIVLPSDCFISSFVEFIGQQIKKHTNKEPITIDLEEGEASDDEQNKENEPCTSKAADSSQMVKDLLMRRLVQESFILHEMTHVKNKFHENREDKSITYTAFDVKCLDKAVIKKAVGHAKSLKVSVFKLLFM